jgi:signal transduction histidine kinase/CheY-like chemotaxis protein
MPEHRHEHRRDHKMRALLSNTGCGSIVIDAPGVVHLLNEGAEALLQLHRADVVGKPLASLGHEQLISSIETAMAAGAGSGEHYVTLLVGGRSLTCRVNRFEHEGEMGATVSVRDDTELVRQQERAEAILASTGDGLIVFAPDNRVTYINPAACELLDVELEGVLNRKTTMTALLGMQPSSASEAASCWDMRNCENQECPAWHADDLRCWLMSGTFLEGEQVSFMDKMSGCYGCDVYLRNSRLLEESGMQHTREITLSEPHHRVLKIRTNPVIDGRGDYIGCVKMVRDVTAEHEISQMKNEFVSTVSHELRTPLTSIKGYVDLILDGETGEINDIQREFLGIVKQNSDRLVALINDMLDISRIESGRIHLKIEPIDIADSIAGAIDTFRAIIDQQGMGLNLAVPRDLPAAAGDRDRVGQVLTNLISNAIKYSPGGGSIAVKARTREHQVIVSVKDTGIGISREDQEHLFDKFYRVDSSLTREIGGTGLGLSICKTIIELLGGQVWVESTPGKGSTFSFSLPIAPKELVRTPEVEGPIVQRGGLVLVVDRNPEIANLIEIYLRKEGYDIIKARSADEAMRLAIEHKPAVITLDVMLEGADGFDLLQQIKENPETSAIPVVILSIVCDEGKSCRLGAANYLEKPIDQERLIGIVDDLVGTIDSPTVLVVDDDKHIVDVLSHNLKSRGFAVAQAYNGLEAMAAIQRAIPDLILLDLRMPEMDGYQVIEQVKRSPMTKHIPIVVMTAYHFDREKTDILELAAEQVAKPFTPEALAEKVAEILEAEVKQ